VKSGGSGGANTKTGLIFEGKTDLATIFKLQKNYEVKVCGKYKAVYFKQELVAYIFQKHEIYHFLREHGVEWEQYISAKLLPDDSIFCISNKTVFIIEKKFQQTDGSTDEKLQTGDFKKKQYEKLFAPLEIQVEFAYLLNDFFRRPRYEDVLSYILSVDCKHYFNSIPIEYFGLPVSDE
jgi:hypothetical protein